MTWYKTGRIEVTTGSTSITGSGTDFIQHVKAGFAFIGPDFGVYEIAAIASATQITLATSYRGPSVKAQPYGIVQTQSVIAELSRQTAALLTTFAAFRDAYDSGALVGKGLQLRGILSSAAELPRSGQAIGDAYLINSAIYVYTGAAWVNSSIRGASGEKGLKGDTGLRGAIGPINQLSIGSVSRGDHASATLTGSAPQQQLHLVLPKGDQGIQGIQGQAGKPGIGTVSWVNNVAPDAQGRLALAPSHLGLNKVNNTADLDKPISKATQAALDASDKRQRDALNDASKNAYGRRTISSTAPSGGANGDIWYQV